MNQLIAGRIAKHMKLSTRYDGRVMKKKELYELFIAKGFTMLKHRSYDDGTDYYALYNSKEESIDVPKMVFDNPEVLGLATGEHVINDTPGSIFSDEVYSSDMKRMYWLLSELEDNGSLDELTRGDYHSEAKEIENKHGITAKL